VTDNIIVIDEKLSIDMQKSEFAFHKEVSTVMRSCWNCNPAHDFMKTWDNVVIDCFGCGRPYYHGHDLWALGKKYKLEGSEDAKEPMGMFDNEAGEKLADALNNKGAWGEKTLQLNTQKEDEK